MRAQSDAMTRKPCPPPLQGGAMPRAERIAGCAGARFLPHLFFPAPSFYPFIRTAALLLLDIAPRPIDGECPPRRRPACSNDGKTPSADHRSGPTSWRKASARQSGCLCKPTTQTNAANEAALGPGHAALAVPIRSAPTRASLNAGRLAPSAPFPDPIQRRLGARRGGALSRGGNEEE